MLTDEADFSQADQFENRKSMAPFAFFLRQMHRVTAAVLLGALVVSWEYNNNNVGSVDAFYLVRTFVQLVQGGGLCCCCRLLSFVVCFVDFSWFFVDFLFWWCAFVHFY